MANVDRVEWFYFPDQQTALNALMAGEIDYFEQPANDLAPILESNPDITVEVNDPLGNIGFARFNHLLPPFDNPEIRSEEHTSELQSLMRTSYAVFCLKKKNTKR